MLGLNQPQLINILGHAAGALIFAIFLFLLFSGRGWSGLRGRYLSGLAAGLSLVWNLGSLVVLVCPNLPPLALNLVIAVSFSVLSLLPAVLLHVSVKDTRPVLVAFGYALSAVAVGMHFWEIRGNGPALHQDALRLVIRGSPGPNSGQTVNWYTPNQTWPAATTETPSRVSRITAGGLSANPAGAALLSYRGAQRAPVNQTCMPCLRE
jgi:hypothetical protein